MAGLNPSYWNNGDGEGEIFQFLQRMIGSETQPRRGSTPARVPQSNTDWNGTMGGEDVMRALMAKSGPGPAGIMDQAPRQSPVPETEEMDPRQLLQRILIDENRDPPQAMDTAPGLSPGAPKYGLRLPWEKLGSAYAPRNPVTSGIDPEGMAITRVPTVPGSSGWTLERPPTKSPSMPANDITGLGSFGKGGLGKAPAREGLPENLPQLMTPMPPSASGIALRDGGLTGFGMPGAPSGPADLTGLPDLTAGSYPVTPAAGGAPPPAAGGAALDDDAKAASEAIASVVSGDRARGGARTKAAPPAPPSAVTQPEEGSDYGWTAKGRLGNWQTKARDMLGMDDEKSSKIGLSLMSAGAALMSGDANFSRALGGAVNSGIDTYMLADTNMRRDKLADHKMAVDDWETQERIRVADETLGLAYAKFEQDKAEAALDRLDPMKALREKRDQLSLSQEIANLEQPRSQIDDLTDGLTADQAGRLRAILLSKAGIVNEEDLQTILKQDGGL